MSSLLDKGEIKAIVYVICQTCGCPHRLEPGGDAPIYYCRASFPAFVKRLMPGDQIEYEEIVEIPYVFLESFKEVGL